MTTGIFAESAPRFSVDSLALRAAGEQGGVVTKSASG